MPFQAGKGFHITGGSTSDYAGLFLGSAGDINGDGYEDALLGQPLSSRNNRASSGALAILYGRSAAAFSDIDLANPLFPAGTWIYGGAVNSNFGWTTSMPAVERLAVQPTYSLAIRPSI
eukprot:gene17254-19672_t